MLYLSVASHQRKTVLRPTALHDTSYEINKLRIPKFFHRRTEHHAQEPKRSFTRYLYSPAVALALDGKLIVQHGRNIRVDQDGPKLDPR